MTAQPSVAAVDTVLPAAVTAGTGSMALSAVPPPAAAVAAALATPPAVAAPALTPAAAARAKKLAAGGMDFVERPNAVFISPRNLAPPPPPRPTDAAAAAAAATPAAPSFSLLRWLCTSRSVWSWAVRALLVAGAVGAAVAAVQIYRAWLADMQRRHADRLQRTALLRQRTEGAHSPQTQSQSQSHSGETGVTADNSALKQLTVLVAARYALLQRHGAVLRHVRTSSTGDIECKDSATSASPSNAPTPVQLGDLDKMRLTFGELSKRRAKWLWGALR